MAFDKKENRRGVDAYSLRKQVKDMKDNSRRGLSDDGFLDPSESIAPDAYDVGSGKTHDSENILIDPVDRQPWFKQWASAFISVGLVIVIFAVTQFFASANESSEKEQSIVLTKIRQKVIDLQQESSSSLNSTLRKKTGVDYSRKSTDDKFFANFAELVFSWKDVPHYLAQRELLLRRYPSLSKTSNFVKNFLPDKNALSVKTPDGNSKLVDPYRNMTFIDAHSIVTGVSGDWYDYFALVNVKSDSPTSHVDGSVVTVAMTYRVDTLGNISDVDAWLVTTRTATG